MSKRKAEGGLEHGIYSEGDTTEVCLAEATPTPQTTNIQVDTSAEGGTREAPVTPAAVPASHLDEVEASPFWVLLRNVGNTVW